MITEFRASLAWDLLAWSERYSTDTQDLTQRRILSLPGPGLDWIAGGYTVHDHTVAPVCSLQHVPAQVSKHGSHASHESSGQAESTQWRCLGSPG